jgi:hypothetical protein
MPLINKNSGYTYVRCQKSTIVITREEAAHLEVLQEMAVRPRTHAVGPLVEGPAMHVSHVKKRFGTWKTLRISRRM